MQCDGVSPVCGRCKGYGNKCTWPRDRKRPRESDDGEELIILRDAVRAYDQLVTSTLALNSLPIQDRQTLDVKRTCVRRCLPAALLASLPVDSSKAASPASTAAKVEASTQLLSTAQRYLGEASDVKFFNVIKNILRDTDSVEHPDADGFDTYEKNESLPEVESGEAPIGYPKRDRADVYINTYFRTIHVAYPFVNEMDFREEYEKLWTLDATDEIEPAWMSLFCKYARSDSISRN